MRLTTSFDRCPWTYGEVLFVVRNCLPDRKTGRRRMTAEFAAEVIGRSAPSVRSLLARAELRASDGRRRFWRYGSSRYPAAFRG